MLFTAPGDFSTSGVWHRLCPRDPPKKHTRTCQGLSLVLTPGQSTPVTNRPARTPHTGFSLPAGTGYRRCPTGTGNTSSTVVLGAKQRALLGRPSTACTALRHHPYFGSTVCCAVHALCGPFKVPTSSKFLHWRSCRMPASDLLIDGVPGRATALYPVVNKGMGQRTAWNC